MTTVTASPVPWQLTGNHWLALPCVHPADGAVHAVGVMHRGARAAIEFAGRRPELGKDKWCVSWNLYRPDGTPLPATGALSEIVASDGKVFFSINVDAAAAQLILQAWLDAPTIAR